MPMFLCRWPNGDCSIVQARNKTEAIERLDEVANAEGCPIVTLPDLQVHLTLTDDGELALDCLGEDTAATIFEHCYPVLSEALAAGRAVGPAVQAERTRQEGSSTAEDPLTDVGRRAKAQLDMPTTLVDRMVSGAAKRRLRAFKPKGRPS